MPSKGRVESRNNILRPKAVNTARLNSAVVNAVRANQGHPQKEDQGYVDSGCSRHMTGNMSYLSYFKEFDGGYGTFGGGAKGGKITRKGTLKTGSLILRMRTLSRNYSLTFLLPDESQILLKVPRKNNMYSVDMKNIVPKKSLTCLVAKATLDESMLWHRRLGSEVSIGEGTTSKETDTSQDYIVMPLWKDSLLFDSPSTNVSHDKPKPYCDTEKKDGEGVSNASGVDDQERPKSSTPNINTVWPMIGDIQSGVQTRGMTKTANEQGLLSVAYERKPYEDLNTYLFFCFLSQEEPKRVTKALSDSAWVEAMQEELLQFKLQKPPGFDVHDYPDKVYKVVKALYGLHQAPRAWYETLAKYLLDNGFHRGKIDQTLFIKKQKGDILLVQKEDGIFISQDKYVTDILKKFGFQDVRTASTPMDTEKPLLKDSDGDDVDVHLYRSMIGSLMYLTSSRPDIMFARFSFDLVAFSDSDYVGASSDRKSTTGGCQFLGCRLISW
ncbi:putative ribonuclease H-like domain-containing protein [Tanacetum coccineum]